MSTLAEYIVPSPIQQITFPWAEKRNLKFYVKRDDLIHSAVSGNKWRKLKFNILQAKHLKKEGVLTFGGAYSNHILATAHACMTNGMSSMAIIRGEELDENSNEILQQCAKWGMSFKFISREEYQLKDDYEYLNELKDEFRAYYIVPEGGKNFLGMVGCQEINRELDIDFDDLWVAQGTCTTSIGIAMSAKGHQTIHAVPVLKGFDASMEIQMLMKRQGLDADMIEGIEKQMKIHPDYHFGGYGKTTPELIEFIKRMNSTIDIPLDTVYTGKAFYGMLDHYQNNPLTDKKIVFVHTGGLIAGKVQA